MRDPVDAAVNLITPLPTSRARFREWWHRRILGSEPALDLARRAHLTNLRPVDSQFRRLSHLHYARWSVCRSLPHIPCSRQPRETSRFTLQLFTSYFDHGWRPYLGSFIETTQDGLVSLWGDAPSWRYASDGHRRFENFVVDQVVENLHVFSAYPQWSCTDVRSMLRLHHDAESDRRSRQAAEAVLDRSPAVDVLDAALLRRVQHVAGSLEPPDPYLARCPAVRGRLPEGRIQTHGATFLIPFPRRSTALAAAVAASLPHTGLPLQRRVAASPFARVPGTHFARLAIIDADTYVQGRSGVDPFESSYLLLSAEIDPPTDWWLDTLIERWPALRTTILASTYLPHGDGAAVRSSLLEHCEIPPALEHIDYPDTSVGDIYAAAAYVARMTGTVAPMRGTLTGGTRRAAPARSATAAARTRSATSSRGTP